LDWIKRKYNQRWFSYEIWNVGTVNKDIDDICRDGRLKDVVWFPRQRGYSFIADPFVLLSSDADLTVLVENFEYTGTCKGKISRCRVAPGTGQYQLHDVLVREWHLSYPYVFSDSSSQYCIPEMHEARRCDLYKIEESGDLQFVRTVIANIAVGDPTVFFENGSWWLFCTHGGSTSLYAYHAKTLDGEWRAHAANPIKSDISSSRPAGPPYRRCGDLYRPGQDCSTTYGGAVVISKILELTPDRFREEFVCRIAPESPGEYPDGFHTINVLDGACVVDGKKIVTDWLWFFRSLRFGARVHVRRRRVLGGPS
jgi:hypothetical protein